MKRRVTVEKTPNRAVATPPFRPLAAQVNHGVAPALWHSGMCRSFFHGDEQAW